MLKGLRREQGPLICSPKPGLGNSNSLILGLYWDNGKGNGNYYNGEANGKENGK